MVVGAVDADHPIDTQLISQVAERVRGLAAGYEPPDFAQAPSRDATLFLCAIDHRTGYGGAHLVAGDGPYEGSDLLWALGCSAERRDPGLLSARSLGAIEGDHVEEIFRIDAETVAGARDRARLWRDLAAGLAERYEGSAEALLAAAQSRLGGPGGLIERLGEFEAYGDPLAKKAFLLAKIAARRGWFVAVDPESWEVCADNVLMRLALRSGLVRSGPVETVRATTREALKRVARETEIEPPLLDDLLWELGRHDPDLLGTAGGEVLEPARPSGSLWY